MKAVLVPRPGPAGNMIIGDTDTPVPKAEELLVKVQATAVNRADTLQRRGFYPPPAGASEILGLEMSGVVEQVGSAVKSFQKGDPVFGLLPGGGYAEYAVIHENMAQPLPTFLSPTDAVAIPEVFLTAYQALRWLANLTPGETVLIHAGASGVGTAAIQLAQLMDAAQILVTASEPKHKRCLELGATAAIDYKKQSFSEVVADATNGAGVNVILDFIMGPYFNDNLNSLSRDGRLVMLAALGGGTVDNINLMKVLAKRLQITGSTLRSRSRSYQAALSKEFFSYALPFFKSKKLKPIIDSVFSWQEVIKAHEYVEANKSAGKVILTID